MKEKLKEGRYAWAKEGMKKGIFYTHPFMPLNALYVGIDKDIGGGKLVFITNYRYCTLLIIEKYFIRPK